MSGAASSVCARSMRRWGAPSGRWAVVGIAACCCGCAHVYVDDQGRTNVIGLAWVTVTPPSESAGQAVRTRTLGVALTRAEIESSLAVGYQDTTLAHLRNHVLVRADELRKPGEVPQGERHAASKK
ncbi:hypothetical protein [Roseateles noduli]|uniref:hypothetical protein n=1 Tax=Roseateles noduli TaxID=2052484 RepID=UPI003D65674D